MPKKSLLISITIITLLGIFQFSHQTKAELPTLLPDDGHLETGDYQLADFMSLAINATQIILAVAASLAFLAFVIGGLIFLISRGNPEMVTKGKNSILGGIIGLFIVFFSWNIVDFTLSKLGYDSKVFGDWYKRPGRIDVPPPSKINKGTTPSTPGQSTTKTPNSNWNWDYKGQDNDISKQLPDASQAVIDLMNCMDDYAKQNGSTALSYGNISSIGDSKHIGSLSECYTGDKNGCKNLQTKCAHSCKSCHYGGSNGGGKSYAIDFGDESKSNILKSALDACKSFTSSYRPEDSNGNELSWGDSRTTHIHASAAGSSGCY